MDANHIGGYGRRMAHNLMESAVYLSGLLAKGFSRSLQQKASRLGVSPGQFPILMTLWSEDGITQRELVGRLEIEQATIANTLSRMVRDGLVDRRPHPTDKRAQLLFLTDKAKALEEDVLKIAREADDAMFSGFRRFERELMLEYMRWAIENARKMEDGEEPSTEIHDIRQIPV